MFGLTNFVILMTESHIYLLDIKSSPSLTGQITNRSMSSIRFNLLTKTQKLKTPGGIIVFRVLVQVCTGLEEGEEVMEKSFNN